MDTKQQLPKNLEEYLIAMKVVSKMSCDGVVAYLAGETLPFDEKTVEGELKNLEYLGNKNIIYNVLDKITQQHENILRTKTVRCIVHEDIDTFEEKRETLIQELCEQVDWYLFPELKSTEEKEEYIKTNMYSIIFLQYIYWCTYSSSYKYENFIENVDYYSDIDHEYEREQNMKYMKKYCM